MKEHALKWGVPVITIDRKRFIDADLFLAAMEKASANDAATKPEAEQDPTDRVLAQLGLVRR